MRRIIFFTMACLLLAGCEKQSPLVHIIEAEDFNWMTDDATSGKSTRLRVFAQSESDAISRILLTEYDEQYGDNTIFDTTFVSAGRTVNYWRPYQIPQFADTTLMRFTSQVWTTTGQTLEYHFSFRVLPSNANMRTIDGITLYSALSGKRYGYNLTHMNTIFPETADSTDLVFFDRAPQDSALSDMLSREWESTSGVYFARFESFDYGEATITSIQRAYDICTHTSVIQGIQNDDVILFGSRAEAYGVIKVLLVSDEAGQENDRYVFSMKTFLQTTTGPEATETE